MKVQPINFATRHKEMLSYAKTVVEGRYLRIPRTPQTDKLVIAMKTAFETDGKLDKESTSYDDIFDAFRLSLLHYKARQEQQGDDNAS